MPRTALRSGAPVTTWFGSEVPSNATAHLRAKRGHEPVRSSRNGVAAHDDERDPQHDRRDRAGKAGVAPDGDHDTRTTSHDDRQGERARDDQPADGAEVLASEPPLDAPAGQEGHFEPRLGHEPALHAAPRADVEDGRRFVAEVHQRLADRQRRLHVPGGPATGDEREGTWRATP